jgi:aminopeptidase N
MRTDAKVWICAPIWLLLPVAVVCQAPEVRGYGFDVTIPDSGTVIRATGDLNVRSRTGGDDTLRLSLVGMTVDSVCSVAVEGRRWPVPFAHDGRTLVIVLTERARALGNVRIFYHGAPQDGLIIQANARGRRSAFGDNWPERARYWLPTIDDPSHKATVAFIARVPSGWKVIGNGRLLDHPEPARRTRFWSWLEGKPIPTYTMVLGAGEFTVSRHPPVHGIPVEVWTYPEDSAFADSGPFRRATEIVATMERLVGPFPYEKLAHVESATRYGGMENSSAIFYAEKPYVDRTMHESVVRHETAHQWFGDAVTERAWPHLWLSEGFASYFDLVVGAALDGDSVLAAGLRRDAATYFASSVVDRPLVDTVRQDPMKLLNENSYQKGAWVLHMLRGAVGDSTFFRGIREYYRVYRDSTAVSADFQQVMQRAAGRDLGGFFRQWLWQPGYPRLTVTWRYEPADHRVRLEVAQGQPDAWGVFRLPRLEIEARTAGGARVRRVFSMDARTMIAYIEMDEPPAAILVDPDVRLLLTANVTP